MSLHYLSGFGGHFESEAVKGALPKGRNSPQKPAFGLYAEQLSGTAFTMPRHENRRSWLYRMRPTADHGTFTQYQAARLFGTPAEAGPLAPNRLRWDPPADLPTGTDFVDGLVTMLQARTPEDLEGCALHLYRADKSMNRAVCARSMRRSCCDTTSAESGTERGPAFVPTKLAFSCDT